jgi:hypothetical protein
MTQQDQATITAYYGTSASCQKFLLWQADWDEAQVAPDHALWSLTPQSTTVIDRTFVSVGRTGNLGTATWPNLALPKQRNARAAVNYLEPSYAGNSPSNARGIYPWG